MACSNPGQVIDMFENSDLLQCAVCFNTFRKAKVLPCHHSFCLECLEQTFRVYKERSSSPGSGPGRLILRMPCPTCRTPVRIPRAGIPALPDDFRVAQLLDMLSEVSKMSGFTSKPSPLCKEGSLRMGSTVIQTVILCELCKVMGKELQAKKYCSSCSKLVCDECIYKHGSGVFKDHKLYDIVLCMLHPTEVIKYFCKDCEQTACLACLMEYHKDHAASEIQDQFRAPEDVDRFILDLVHQKVEHCTDLISKLEHVSETLSGKYKEATTDVQSRMQALMLYVEMHGRDMVEFLENELSKQKEDIGDRIEQLEIHRAVLENFKRKTNGDIFSSMKQLNEKCAEIQDIMSEDMKNFFAFAPEKSFPELGMFIPARLEKPQLLSKPKSKLLDKPVWLKTITKPFCEHIPSYLDIKSIAFLPGNLLVCLVGNNDECHVCILDMEGETVRCVNPIGNATEVYSGRNHILLLCDQQIKIMSLESSMDRDIPVDVFNKYNKPFTSCCYMSGNFPRFVATIAEENMVIIFSLQGEVEKEFHISLGESDNRVHEPRSVYYTTKKEIVLHDTADDALYRFSEDGTYLGALLDEAGTKKKFIGAFSEARIVEGTLGNIIILEKYNRKVNMFSAEGRFLRNLFPEYENKDDLPNQEGCAITSDGRIMIAMADKIEVYQLYD